MLCRKALPLAEAMMRVSLLDLQKGRYTDAYEGLLGVSRDDRAPIRMRADALSNAAVCQLRLHGWAKAEACAKSAVEMDPSHVDAWFNLGGAYKEQGNRLDALQAFRKVCTLRPERMDAWRYRASVSQSLFLWDEAIEAWTTMLTKGGDAHAFKGRVECLVRSGKAPLADQETARFLEQNPANDLARYLRVLVLSDLQRFDEALPLASKLHGTPQLDLLSVWVNFHAGFVVDAEKRLEKLPESARAHILRLDVAGEDKLPEQVSAAREYLARPRAEAPDELADLHFHLGRIADGQKQYDAAWDHYSAAHRMLAKVQPFSEDGHQTLDAWLRRRPWESVTSMLEESHPQWIFMVGMPRSGTTLLEQIFDMHPAIHGAGELHDMHAMAQGFYANGDSRAVTQACADFARKGREIAPESHWIIDKMPHNFLFAGMLLHLFPRSRVVWCRRDPLDTSVSIWRQHFRGIHPYAHDLGTLGRYFRWHEEVMDGCREDYPQRVLEVSYESLVDDMPGVVTGLLRALGKDWDPACARFYENPRRILTASQWQVNKPIYRDAVGSWKRYRDHVEPLLLAETVMSDSANESQRR